MNANTHRVIIADLPRRAVCVEPSCVWVGPIVSGRQLAELDRMRHQRQTDPFLRCEAVG